MLSTRLVKNYKLTSVLSAAYQGRSLLKKTSIKMDKNIKVNFEYKKNWKQIHSFFGGNRRNT
jgi:hypothetical protein